MDHLEKAAGPSRVVCGGARGPIPVLKPHRPIGITPDPSGRATGFELRRDLNPQTARPLRRCEKLNGERRRGHGSSRSLDIQVSPYPWWG